MNKYLETFQTWDKIANLYQDKFMHLDLYNDTYDSFLDLIKKSNSSILDIGCGPGNITQYLLDKQRNLKITGIDISENMIALARKNNPNATFITMDSRNIHRINVKYDAIICGFCIPYLSDSDCEKLISDCNDLLGASGILYLSFVDGNYKDSGYIKGSGGDRTFFYYHSIKKLQETIQLKHYDTIKLISKNYIKADGTNEKHTIIILKKRVIQT